MPTKPTFTPSDYRAYIKISTKRHLLVEGRDDKQAFKLLFHEIDFRNSNLKYRHSVFVDTAENLIDFPTPIGNREKVEFICSSIAGKSYENKLVGFVDREFRQFVIGPILGDTLAGANIINRLVWSEGHSVENYFFAFDLLKGPLRDFSTTTYFDEALDLLETIFQEAIKLACAASLTGLETDKLYLFRALNNWKILTISGTNITFNLTLLTTELHARGILPPDAAHLVSRFQYWASIVDKTNFNLVRKLSHGHIGLAYIWSAYARCVYEVCKIESEAARVLQAIEQLRFNASISYWVRAALDGRNDYPRDVIRLLNI